MPPFAAALVCVVIAIADGDTFTVRCEAQAEQAAQTIIIRLAEIDAPEKRQPFGERSKQALAAVCRDPVVRLGIEHLQVAALSYR